MSGISQGASPIIPDSFAYASVGISSTVEMISAASNVSGLWLVNVACAATTARVDVGGSTLFPGGYFSTTNPGWRGPLFVPAGMNVEVVTTSGGGANVSILYKLKG
jgi:hypothetical protein